MDRIRFEKWEKVKIVKGSLAGNEYIVEGYWDELEGESWLDTDFRPVILQYMMRVINEEHLKDYRECDEVLYGKIGRYGYIVHVNEIERIKE